MRPKPSYSSTSTSIQSTINGNGSSGIIPGKPKLSKYPTWSSVSSGRNVSNPGTPSGGTSFDDDMAESVLAAVESAAKADIAPPIPSNENGKRYSRQELLDVWSQMKDTGRLTEVPLFSFPPLATVGTNARKATMTMGSIGGGMAKEGSKEYEKFFSGSLLSPELQKDSALNEDISHLPAVKDLKDFDRPDSPFNRQKNSGQIPASAHFPMPSHEEVGPSDSSPSVQHQSLSDPLLVPLANLTISRPDFSSPFIQPAGSSWSPFGGTPTSQHAQLQSSLPSQLDHDLFVPAFPSQEAFSPIPAPQSAFSSPRPQHQFAPPPPGLLPPILVPAQLIQWVYLDNNNVIQGPFTGTMMHGWYVNQWLAPDLKIKRVEENDYYPLAEFCSLVGNDSEPFMMALPRADFDVPLFNQQQQQQQQQHEPQLEPTKASATVHAEKPQLEAPATEPKQKSPVERQPEVVEIKHIESKQSQNPKPKKAADVLPPPPPPSHPVEDTLSTSANVPETEDAWSVTPTSSVTPASSKHKLQPLPPAPSVVKPTVESASAAVPTAPIAPWAKATAAVEKPIKTSILKEIEKHEAHKLLEEKKQQERLKAVAAAEAAMEAKIAAAQATNVDIPAAGSVPPGLPRAAAWTTTVIVPTPVKKTVAQIHKEEEEEARKRKAAASGVMTTQGRKYADITAAKPIATSRTALPPSDGSAWTTVGAGGKKSAGTPPIPVPAIPVTTTVVPTAVRRAVSSPASAIVAGSAVKTKKPTVAMTPSVEEFFKWCRVALKGVSSGVNQDELLKMLLSLPLGSADTVEIIADTVYSNSTTLDGRRFAEEFVKRRKTIEGAQHVPLAALVVDGADKTAAVAKLEKTGEGWNEVLKGNTKAAKAAAAIAASANGGTGNDGWNTAFKIVGSKKKGGKR
ncbi:hypothetical protein V1512DRAFT_272820 [Lipomyces arxii]|uniref:uncharacterized protein n=1 Tax=Lipomyces arxii TaxID=56418 RepID=UPI0034CDD437